MVKVRCGVKGDRESYGTFGEVSSEIISEFVIMGACNLTIVDRYG